MSSEYVRREDVPAAGKGQPTGEEGVHKVEPGQHRPTESTREERDQADRERRTEAERQRRQHSGLPEESDEERQQREQRQRKQVEGGERGPVSGEPAQYEAGAERQRGESHPDDAVS